MAESIESVLEDLERRRRDRWAVAALLLVAVLAAGGMLLVEDAPMRFAPWVGAAFVAVTVLFAGSVVAQEQRASRAIRVLVAEREQISALSARVTALRTVHDAMVGVAASEELDEAFESLLSGALELTGAETGTVWLRVGDSLTVAVSRGPSAPSPGTTIGVDEEVAGMVVREGEPVIAGRGGDWARGPGPSVVAAPLRLPDRVAGSLVVERHEELPPFDDVDRTAVALFAEQAALTLRATTRLDRQRERVATLTDRERATAMLLAATAHDLKAPLSAVTGYMQLLRARDERIDRDRRLGLYDDVLAEADRTLRLINDLSAAAATQGRGEVERVEVDLAELVRRIARTAEGLAHGQGGERDVSVDAPTSVTVTADAVALERALVNVVDNAITHSPPGSPVVLRAGFEDGRAVLAVRDHGPGIADEDREELFEAFVSRGRGSGLGLYVVQAVAAAHGGEVRLDSGEWGTEVQLRLPER